MPITENDRLDLRHALARALGSARLANVAMEAMPPIDDQLASKTDVETASRELRAEMAQLRSELRAEMAELRSELRGEMAELRGEMAELRGELKADLASNLRLMVVTQLTTMMMLGAWVSAVT